MSCAILCQHARPNEGGLLPFSKKLTCLADIFTENKESLSGIGMDDQTHPVLQEQIEVITLSKEEEDQIHIETEDPVTTASVENEQTQTVQQQRPRVFSALKCIKCNKRFRNPAHLQQHVRLHRAPTVYKCGQCQESFRELTKFLQHREIHPPLPKKRKQMDYNAAFQIGLLTNIEDLSL